MKRITELRPQERSDERVNVFVDGEFRIGLAAEVAQRAGLRVGDSIEEGRLVELEREDVLWKARESAYSLLAHRARTAEELRRRLARKGFEGDVIESCIAELDERGWVDDRAFAESFARDRIRLRPRGTRRVVQELRARGVAPEVAEPAVEEALAAEGRSEPDLAREAAEGWARRKLRGGWSAVEGEDRFALRRSLYAYLARRGFGGETIRAAMAEVLDDAGDGE